MVFNRYQPTEISTPARQRQL